MTHLAIKDIQKQLIDQSDEYTRLSSDRYFKEDQRTPTYGVKTVSVTKIAKENYAKIKKKTKEEIYKYCELLWKSGYLEETFIACHWSYKVKKTYEEKDIKIFEKWIDNYINNWASCDSFCNHTVGEYILKFPQQINKLKTWAKSKNRWMKRASAVSLVIPARKGLFLKDIFEIADILLIDKDDMVQKGYGWILKVSSEKHLDDVFNYVLKHKSVMPRTALRYAIEKMPQEMRKQAMAK